GLTACCSLGGRGDLDWFRGGNPTPGRLISCIAAPPSSRPSTHIRSTPQLPCGTLTRLRSLQQEVLQNEEGCVAETSVAGVDHLADGARACNGWLCDGR